jgi:hypothetical protein
MCFFCSCQNVSKEFFSQENGLVFCGGVCCVMEALGHQHDPTERHLFIDSSEVSLKGYLLDLK